MNANESSNLETYGTGTSPEFPQDSEPEYLTTNDPATTDKQTLDDTDTAERIDADVVQDLERGDIINATRLTTLQHEKYLESDDTDLMDVFLDDTEYLVLDVPEDDGTRVFAAKIIKLEDYNPEHPEHATTAYDITGAQTWNITTPRAPYENEGTGVVISRLGENESLVTHVLRDITVNGHQDL